MMVMVMMMMMMMMMMMIMMIMMIMMMIIMMIMMIMMMMMMMIMMMMIMIMMMIMMMVIMMMMMMMGSHDSNAERVCMKRCGMYVHGSLLGSYRAVITHVATSGVRDRCMATRHTETYISIGRLRIWLRLPGAARQAG